MSESGRELTDEELLSGDIDGSKLWSGEIALPDKRCKHIVESIDPVRLKKLKSGRISIQEVFQYTRPNCLGEGCTMNLTCLWFFDLELAAGFWNPPTIQ